jgi:hypothetical protein
MARGVFPGKKETRMPGSSGEMPGLAKSARHIRAVVARSGIVFTLTLSGIIGNIPRAIKKILLF